MALATRTAPSVLVLDDEAVFDGFVETDPNVVDLLGQAVEPDEAAHTLLRLGAHASRLVSTNAETDDLQRRLSALLTAVTTSVDGTLGQLKAATAQMFESEHGEVAQVLGRFTADLRGMLDPARQDSIATDLADALRARLDEVLASHLAEIHRLVDPEESDGPIGKVVGLVGDHTANVAAELRRVSEAVLRDRARAEGLDRSGVKGGMAGDVVVHLNVEDTFGRDASYAVEAKSKRQSLRATLTELDRVMANRGALAAITVFSETDIAPVRVPFQPIDSRCIVVLDRSELDPLALQVACQWARLSVRRRLAGDAETLDVEAIEAAIDRARRSLGRASTIRRALSTAGRAVGDARAELDELVAEAEGALRTITDHLRPPCES